MTKSIYLIFFIAAICSLAHAQDLFENEEENVEFVENTSTEYTVAATWIAKPGKEDEVALCLFDLVEPSQAEEGMLLYIPNRDPKDPSKFFIYEQYVDEAAFIAHTKSEHYQRLVLGCAVPRLLKHSREIYTPLA